MGQQMEGKIQGEGDPQGRGLGSRGWGSTDTRTGTGGQQLCPPCTLQEAMRQKENVK